MKAGGVWYRQEKQAEEAFGFLVEAYGAKYS
jgi:hypothetical protein